MTVIALVGVMFSKDLSLALIAGRPPKEGGPEKAVAYYDEDSVTMAVAAAIACLEGIDRASVDADESHPHAAGVRLEGVLLYGLERVSHQPEAARLQKLPRAWLEAFARRIEALGLAVTVHE